METRLKELLSELIRIPSPTGQERALQEYLEGRLKRLGFTCLWQEVLPSRPNLIAWRGRSSLLLCTHADTLPASSYELIESGPFLKGRGVIDAKGQIAAILLAVERTDAPVALAFTVDEEDKGVGGKELAILPWVQKAVVLEPTGLQIANAQAGAIEVEIIVKGKEVHGACPERGENSILKALKLLEQIQRLPSLQREHPLFPPPFVTPYWIQGGDPELYLVPGETRVRVDIKITPSMDMGQILAELENFVAPFGSMKLLDSDPPFETSPEAGIIGLLRAACEDAMGMEPSLVGMPSWTDAEPLHRKGLEVVVFGAGEIHLAHTGQEMVKAEELVKLTRVLESLLIRAAGE